MKSGVKLETLTWIESERWFARDPVVVMPLGAAAKQHGPHLPLNNDALIAAWLADEVARQLPVLVAPLINASYYPAFVEYPGSISLSANTARDLIVESCASLASFGATRFYVINTGLSTLGPLRQAAQALAATCRLEFLDLEAALESLPDGLLEQEYGSHADEHETSLMLYIAPEVVDMSRAVDDGRDGEGGLSRTPGKGIWSASGVYGRATLASREKGKVIATRLVEHCIEQVDRLRLDKPS